MICSFNILSWICVQTYCILFIVCVNVSSALLRYMCKCALPCSDPVFDANLRDNYHSSSCLKPSVSPSLRSPISARLLSICALQLLLKLCSSQYVTLLITFTLTSIIIMLSYHPCSSCQEFFNLIFISQRKV